MNSLAKRMMINHVGNSSVVLVLISGDVLCHRGDEVAQDDVMNSAYWIFDFEWFTVRSWVTYDLTMIFDVDRSEKSKQ